MKNLILTLILALGSLSAMAKTEQTLTCTLLKKNITGNSFNYDQQIEVKLSYTEKDKHRFEITGRNLKQCAGRTIPNYSQGAYVGFNQNDYYSSNRQCAIYDLTVSWRGTALEIDTKSPISISSYGFYVTYGAADYTCVSKTNKSI